MKTYRVKEIFGPTLQGEGQHAGRSCLFLRLSGCNAWDGRPETRADSACPYCDTDFFGGEALDVDGIRAQLQELHPDTQSIGCVLTGGEPLLQADVFLLELLADLFAWVDIETNGTQLCPERAKHVFISCSPKKIPLQDIRVKPDWWKILIPDQEAFLDMALASDKPVYVQPTCPDQGLNDPQYQSHLERCVQLCHERGCRLSLQQHKYLGLP